LGLTVRHVRDRSRNGGTTILFVANLFVAIRYQADNFPLLGFLTEERLATATGSFAGTVIGAWLAFLFAARSRKLVREDEEVAAGNLALFALSCMLNATWQFRNEITGPYRQRPDAWLNLPASAPLSETFDLDRKSLSFIAGEEPNAFQAIVLEEVRYGSLAYNAKHHRDLILNKVWPVLGQNHEMGDQKLEAEIRKTLGPALVRDLEVTTRALIEHADENVESLPDAFKELRSALKRRYPNRKFLDFKAPPTKR
jgi:hypothetical protein